MKLFALFLAALLPLASCRLLEVPHRGQFSNADKELMVDQVIDEKLARKPPARKLVVSLGRRQRPPQMRQKPRKNIEAAVSNPRLSSYHPISLAFIGQYNMDVKEP